MKTSHCMECSASVLLTFSFSYHLVNTASFFPFKESVCILGFSSCLIHEFIAYVFINRLPGSRPVPGMGDFVRRTTHVPVALLF